MESGLQRQERCWQPRASDAGLLFHSVVYEQPTKILNKEVTGLKLYLKGTTLEGRSMEN